MLAATREGELTETKNRIEAFLTIYGAMLENNDLDRGSRFIGPVVVTKLSNNPDNRTTWSHGPFNDECAMRFFFGQYPFVLEPGYVYDIIP